ncbi:MAG: hypothetical protein WDA75_19305 [Candidatus Latescibacterota bacterium]|jgi:hypothetical protein
MQNLDRVTRLLDRVVLWALKTAIVTLLLAYGALIVGSQLNGFRVGRPRVAEAYAFDQLSFTCGETVLRATDGNLVTARRHGELRSAILTGEIQVEWPPSIRHWNLPPVIHQFRMNLHPDDLRRLVADPGLRRLLSGESDAVHLKEEALELFDRGADRIPWLMPTLEFFRPPPPGVMDAAILDQEWGGLWTLTTGAMSPPQWTPSPLAEKGVVVGGILLVVGVVLLAVVAAAGVLGTAVHALSWAITLARTPGSFRQAPLFHGVALLIVLLAGGALLAVIRAL